MTNAVRSFLRNELTQECVYILLHCDNVPAPVLVDITFQPLMSMGVWTKLNFSSYAAYA